MEESLILQESLDEGKIWKLRLNRPKALNALSIPLMEELRMHLEQAEENSTVRCVILTGNERAFAAGADIREFVDENAITMYLRDQFRTWDALRRFRKPLIAGIRGYALGGGLELALLCDIIIAGESARLGLPEIRLGIIPGAGGTQWLPRLIGKHRAMKWILTGRQFSAREAYEMGLLTEVVPDEDVERTCEELAREIAEQPPVAVMMAKDSIQRAYETFLMEGILAERKNFFLLFATEDKSEGMRAFLEKRKPQWKGK